MENKRGSWASNFGFLMAAIGSAVGLGNIWGFPYKMGKSGGFTFLIVYLLLGLFVGLIIMVSELALGRMTRKSPIDAYKMVSKKFGWIGWLAVFAPFVIMSFYSVLGGYVLQYMSLNLAELAFGLSEIFGTAVTGTATFGAMLGNPFGMVMFTVAFMVICMVIVMDGISGGIEKFNKIGMPALFFMLIVVIVKAWTLPNSIEGLKFMFVPGYAVTAGFIDEAPDLITVLGTAGGQMFFSLSLAMGAMITYGSYLDKGENLLKNSAIIVVCDTIVALMAGLAVIPAAVANGINSGVAVSDISLGGPKLLFVTLQDVFSNMGAVGPLFGIIFYTLVLIAAISSAISLMEVLATYFIDKKMEKGIEPDRKRITLRISIAITVLAALVAADGIGSNGFAPADLLGIPVTADWHADWLDFMDCWSEGIAMPVGAMLMALMIGGELKPSFTLNEIHNGCKAGWFDVFYKICITVIVPVVMAFVLAGQIITFFGAGASTFAYIISGVLLAVFAVIAYLVKGKKA